MSRSREDICKRVEAVGIVPVVRAPSPELLRGVFDAAMSIYLDRFLNIPAAKIPQPAADGAQQREQQRRARVRLDQPGLYWFGCPVANHAGRGMLELVMVKGSVPNDARLDRPRQRRP